MNAIIYCRVSSREQVDGTSLESQEVACRDYARRHNLTIVRVFVEEGESAKFADRTQLLALLAFCKDKSNKLSTLIVWKVDRFARSVEDHFSIKATLRRDGVKVVSVTEPIDSDPNGMLMETILAGFAQFDNDVRALRSVQGMQQRLKEGIFPWHPPLGYLPPKMGKKTQPDHPDPRRFEPLKRAWGLFATGAYSKLAIVRLLGSWGVHAYRGRLVSPQTIDHIFQNPFYAGVLRDPWSGTEHEGCHVPMVSRATFARVQHILGRASNSQPHRALNEAFPLRGLVRCPSCEYKLTGALSKGRRKRYPYYSCYRKDCGLRSRSTPAGRVHEEFLQFLAEQSTPTNLSETIVGAVLAIVAKETESAMATTKTLWEESKRQRGQLNELIAMRAETLITDDELKHQRKRIEKEIDDIESAADLAEADVLTKADEQELKASLSDLRSLWQDMPLASKPGFGELIFPAGYAYGRIRTADRGLLFRVFRPSTDDGSNGVPLIKPNLNRLMRDISKFLAIIRSRQEGAGRLSDAA